MDWMLMTEAIFDWGSVGNYGLVAGAMAPAAEMVVEVGRISPGERVLDIGTGTGNGALLAAARGAHATGIDPSESLLQQARKRASEAGLAVDFAVGSAENIPFPDSSFDVLIDVFSLIFVAEPQAAVKEMARVLAPGGRILWTGWVPEGTVVEIVKTSAEAQAKALGRPSYSYSAWYDRAALTGLFAPYGLSVSLEEHELRYAAPSPQAWLEGVAGAHPLTIVGDEILRKAGTLEEVRQRQLEIAVKGNEDPAAFAVRPRYVIGTAEKRE
jgi:ubiquinone/menaquinone biosynthesis C-methylase UbiE